MNVQRLTSLLAVVVMFFSIEVSSLLKKIYLRSESIYNVTVNSYCPTELDDNFAGKYGLYFNSSNIEIKKSIIKKYFNHCGAWCLFDHRDPRNGWYWNSDSREWLYTKDLYTICPNDEFQDSLNKFLNKNCNIYL